MGFFDKFKKKKIPHFPPIDHSHKKGDLPNLKPHQGHMENPLPPPDQSHKVSPPPEMQAPKPLPPLDMAPPVHPSHIKPKPMPPHPIAEAHSQLPKAPPQIHPPPLTQPTHHAPPSQIHPHHTKPSPSPHPMHKAEPGPHPTIHPPPKPSINLPPPPIKSAPEHQERKVIVDMPHYVKVDEFQNMLTGVKTVKNNLQECLTIADKMNELKNLEDKEFEKYRAQMEDLQRKLIFVDKILYEAKGEA